MTGKTPKLVLYEKTPPIGIVVEKKEKILASELNKQTNPQFHGISEMNNSEFDKIFRSHKGTKEKKAKSNKGNYYINKSNTLTVPPSYYPTPTNSPLSPKTFGENPPDLKLGDSKDKKLFASKSLNLQASNVTTLNIFLKYYQNKQKNNTINWGNSAKLLAVEFKKILDEYKNSVSDKNSKVHSYTKKGYDDSISSKNPVYLLHEIIKEKPHPLFYSNTLMELFLQIIKLKLEEWVIE